MQNKFKQLIINIVFILMAFNLHADIVLNQTKIEDGVGNRMVNCITQDSIGFMWFGTDEGLFRFDGYDFLQFRHDSGDKLSISNNYIRSIIVDKNGNLWIGTENGLNRMHQSNPGVFHNFYHDSLDSSSIVDNDIRTLFIDSERLLWIGTYNNGLSRISTNDTKFKHFENFPFSQKKTNSSPSRTITAIAQDIDNRIFICTFGKGLAEFLPNQNRFITYKIKNNSKKKFVRFITDIIIEKNKLWLSTYNSGITCFNIPEISNPDSLTIINANFHNYNSIINSSQSINAITTIIMGDVQESNQSKSILIGTNLSGILYFDIEELNFNLIKKEKNGDTDIANDRVYSFYRDRTGNIWAGKTNGLSIIKKFRTDIIHIKNEPDNPFSINNNNITALRFDNDNSLWIGTENGINLYDPKLNKDNESIHIQTLSAQDKSIYVSDIFRDNEENLLISTFGHGIWQIKKEFNQKYTLIPFAKKEINKFTNTIRFITKILQDKYERLWIGSLEGLLILHKNSPKNNYILKKNNIKHLPNIKQIVNMYEDRSGNIWICTYDKGLVRVTFNSDSLFDLTKYNTTNGLSNDKVLCMTEDSLGNFWIGTSYGLNQLNMVNGKIKQYFEKDGLCNAYIYGILVDNEGNLWISTNQGLSKCYISDDGKYNFQNFFKKDGLQENEFNLKAYAKRPDGIMAFGGINGVNIFSPSSFGIVKNILPVVLTRFLVFNKEIISDSAIYSKKKIHLDYKQNFFSFEFAALEFSTPDKIQYAYQLEGFDKDWIKSGNRRFASYTNLDPGEYTFRLMVSNNERELSNNSTEIKVLIAPPYWQTWWFRFLIFIIISTVLWNLHRFRLRRLLEMERLRIQIASDLHDEIGSSLTKISMYSDLAGKQIQENSGNSLLKKIGITSRDLVNTMSDIVWSVDARNDTLGGLIDRMRDTTADLLNIKNIDFNFEVKDINPQQKIIALIRQNIYLILKEAVTNIAKHSQATNVSIKLENTKDVFIISIIDNGIGIKDMKNHSGNGLKNMQLRATRVKGKIEIIDKNGTTINLITKKL